MSLYRIKQFLWSFSFKLNKDEITYIRKKLNDKELYLFTKLSISEQKHSIRVARLIQIEYDENKDKIIYDIDKDKLVLVALLHDIGKIYKHLNVFDKSILVILNSISNGQVKKYSNIRKVDVYYNHAEKGAELLKKYNYDEDFIFLVKNHHSNIKGYNSLDILKYYDSSN